MEMVSNYRVRGDLECKCKLSGLSVKRCFYEGLKWEQVVGVIDGIIVLQRRWEISDKLFLDSQ